LDAIGGVGFVAHGAGGAAGGGTCGASPWCLLVALMVLAVLGGHSWS